MTARDTQSCHCGTCLQEVSSANQWTLLVLVRARTGMHVTELRRRPRRSSCEDRTAYAFSGTTARPSWEQFSFALKDLSEWCSGGPVAQLRTRTMGQSPQFERDSYP